MCKNNVSRAIALLCHIVLKYRLNGVKKRTILGVPNSSLCKSDNEASHTQSIFRHYSSFCMFRLSTTVIHLTKRNMHTLTRRIFTKSEIKGHKLRQRTISVKREYTLHVLEHSNIFFFIFLFIHENK